MDNKTKLWIKTMDWCCKYWGCHQLPERSFFFKGYQFPICARCTGIILGYIVAVLCIIFKYIINMPACLLLIFPMVLDGSVQYFTKYYSTNLKRVITGGLAGFAFIQFLINLIHFIISV